MTTLAQATDPSLPQPLQYLALWLSLVAGLTAALGLRTSIQSAWNRGPGRRRLLERQLRQVVAGGQLDHVVSLFGPAQFVERIGTDAAAAGSTPTTTVEVHSWVSSDHVLRCYADRGVVISWLVTSRNPRFRPSWRIGGLEITLHETSLADAGPSHTTTPQWMYGANWFGYAEVVGSARPTWYQEVTVGISEAGLMGPYDEMLTAMQRSDGEDDDTPVRAIRNQTSFDTIGVHDRGVPTQDALHLPLGTARLRRVQTDDRLGERIRRAARRLMMR